MPMTCRETTCNDQMIVHPDLIPYLDQITVDKNKIFSDHDPVVGVFQFPGDIPKNFTLKHPTTWTSFDPDKEYMAIAFEYHAKKNGLPIKATDTCDHQTLEGALLQWTKDIEKSVDWAIRMQHADNPEKFPTKNLPKQATGRAKTKKIIQKPMISWLKPACQGQYTPGATANSILLSQKVRQVRRIQSLTYRIKKLSVLENAFEDQHLQLQQEWKAILKAPGYRPNFPAWCANIPEVGWCPLTMPHHEYLHLIQQFAQFECEKLSAKVDSHARKTAKFENLHESAQTIYANTAKQVRKASPEVIHNIKETIGIPAHFVANYSGLVTLQLESTCLIQLHLPLRYAGRSAIINDMTPTTVDIVFDDDDDDNIPDQGQIEQDQCHTMPEVVASKLDEFWGQFWCRDTSADFNTQSTDEDNWKHFQKWLDATPSIPQAPVVLDDPKEWEFALKQMNPKTARGIDSWTVDELRSLPFNAIQSISQIFHRFSGQPFPKCWLKALTIPLGKEYGASTPSKTRPITVLSLIYRWWSKVVTSQVLRHWAKHLPTYIVGFIPGRSPQNEMINTQHQFEISHDNFEVGATQWQGETLDLVKCFNLIPREPARRALIKSGVPTQLVEVWFQSLNNLVRYWKFRDEVVESGLTTTGTPEGDTFSVLCCVAISRIWAHHLQTLQAIPSCYADNWSWRCQQLAQNIAALEATKDFTNDCRLKIDWDKTWAWITYHNHKAAWKAAMKRALPRTATIHVVTSARELGYTMHYNKIQSRKTQKQRHEAALEQVLRIRKLPISLQTKAQLLTDACLSKALCQTETYYVGLPWFKELRSAMSRTLVPDRKITNPYLAVMLLSKYTKDPELHYVQQCIRPIRKFLIQTTQVIRENFLRIASKHNLRPMQVHGPAGTLAMSLMKLGWQITSTGVIHTDTMLILHILESPLDSLLKCAQQAWMKNVSQFCLNRPEWRNLPTIDRTATVKIFMQLPQHQQNVVARFITGSFMEPKQKEHVREGPVTCEICEKAEDSLHHRLVLCPNTEYVRQDYPMVIEFLETHDPCHLHLPIVFQDDWYEFNTWFLHQEWQQEVNPIVKSHIQQENELGIRSLIYSDGSCRNPTNPSFRRASFALIFHPHLDHLQCEQVVKSFQNLQVIPSSFQVFATGPCTNFQSIPRAELLAAMTLMQQDLTTTLHTDSQYVVDICDKLGYILHVAQMQSWANFDILQNIWHNLQQGRTCINKVKAHSLSAVDPPTIETFHKIGNQAADEAAKAMLKHLDKITPMHLEYQEHCNYLLMVKQQMQFRFDIQVARAKCLQQKEHCTNPQTYKTYQDNLDCLFTLQYSDGINYSFDDSDFARLENSLWGTTISHRIMTWLSLLVWPREPAKPGGTGITWYEMAVNFQTVMQCGLVVNVGTTGNDFLPKQLSFPSLEFPFSRQVAAFERAVTTIARLLDREVFPCRRQLSSSLRLLGASHGKQGLIDRPQLPKQTESLMAIRTHFEQHRGVTVDQPPPIPNLTPYAEIEEHNTDVEDGQNWKTRIQKYNKARRRR